MCQQLSFPEPPAQQRPQQQQKSSREDETGNEEPLSAIGGCCLLIVLGGIIVIGLGLRIGFFGGPASNFVLPGAILLILGVIGGTCLWGSFVLSRKSAERKEKEAKIRAEGERQRAEGERQRAQKRAKAYAQWEKLYYCARDDLVFFPGVSNWWLAAHELSEKITQQYYLQRSSKSVIPSLDEF